MNDYRKYYTNRLFDNSDFAACLNDAGIEAAPVHNGVILDYSAIGAMSWGKLPHWIWMNKKYIQNPDCTRPASLRELRDAQDKRDGIKTVGIYALNAFGGFEFGVNTEHEMFIRDSYDENIGHWQKIDEYDIDANDTIVYHVNGIDISAADIMRAGA